MIPLSSGRTRTLDPARLLRIADILKTIGHPVRLEVLRVLEAEEPLSVGEIQERIALETEQSLLSHHLIKMKDKGILTCDKRGMNVYYQIRDRQLLQLFDCMEGYTPL